MGYNDGVYTPPDGATNAFPGQVIKSATWNTVFGDISTALTDIGQGTAIEWTIRDSFQLAITTGVKVYLEIPLALTINSWKILADVSGSVVIDIWVAPFASFPPTVANTIVASAPPTLTSAQSAASSTLTGWTTTIAKGSILAFNVNSASTVNQVTISLDCGRN